jgi:excisionase family DNA binding protein
MDQLLSTGDAAKMLNRSVDRVRDLEREGRLPAQKTRGGQRLFRAEDVARLARQMMVKRDRREKASFIAADIRESRNGRQCQK